MDSTYKPVLVWVWTVIVVLLALGQLAAGNIFSAILLIVAAALSCPSIWSRPDMPGLSRRSRMTFSAAATAGAMAFGFLGVSRSANDCVAAKISYFRNIGSYPVLSDGRDAEDVAREQCRDPIHQEWVMKNS